MKKRIIFVAAFLFACVITLGGCVLFYGLPQDRDNYKIGQGAESEKTDGVDESDEILGNNNPNATDGNEPDETPEDTDEIDNGEKELDEETGIPFHAVLYGGESKTGISFASGGGNPLIIMSKEQFDEVYAEKRASLEEQGKVFEEEIPFANTDFEQKMLVKRSFQDTLTGINYHLVNLFVNDDNVLIIECGAKNSFGGAALSNRCFVVELDKVDVVSVEFREVYT